VKAAIEQFYGHEGETAIRQTLGFTFANLFFYLQIYPLNVTLARERKVEW
jgi:hypothetical protein